MDKAKKVNEGVPPSNNEELKELKEIISHMYSQQDMYACLAKIIKLEEEIKELKREFIDSDDEDPYVSDSEGNAPWDNEVNKEG
jgi:hypothetical protein